MKDRELQAANQKQIRTLIEQGHRAFGSPQAWADRPKGQGGERLVADILATQVDSMKAGSMLFVGLDLGKRGVPYPLIDADERSPIVGHGGDIDVALFLRELKGGSDRYGAHDRALVQDHLVLIDSKEWTRDHGRAEAFKRAREVLQWMRDSLNHPRMVGAGSSSASLRMSYHLAFTGPWLPEAWLAKVTQPGAPTKVEPAFRWWNETQDFVYESPAEVLLGQLCILLSHANPDVRDVVPSCLFSMLDDGTKRQYTAHKD